MRREEEKKQFDAQCRMLVENSSDVDLSTVDAVIE